MNRAKLRLILILCSTMGLNYLGACSRSVAAPEPVGAQQSTADTSIKPYIIKIDDQVSVFVAGHDELNAKSSVLSDGTLSVPTAAPVHAAGMTIAGLTAYLAKQYGRIINQPDVTVSVQSATLPPGRASVLGAVRSPGQFVAQRGFRVLDIIALAGGLSQDVTTSKATLIRSGGEESISLDLVTLYSSPTVENNLLVQDGDVIFVDNTVAQLYQVQITGEITIPGSYPVSKMGISIFDILLKAGGPTKAASLKDAQILHNGIIQIVDLRGYLTNLTGSVNTVRLLPGDVLQIPAIIDRYALMGAVREPRVYNLPDGKPVSLRSALVTAGGADSDADVKNATLLKTDATGKTTSTTVDLAKLLRGENADIQIESGDILYVPQAHPKQPFGPFQLLSLIPLVSLLRH